MNALQRIQLTGQLRTNRKKMLAASNPLERIKSTAEVRRLRQQLGLGMKTEMQPASTPQPTLTHTQKEALYSFDEGKTATQRQKDNNAAIALLQELQARDAKPEELSLAEKETLAKYSGSGGGLTAADGKVGSAHEYYTPAPVVNAIWDSLKEMGFDSGRVLDPKRSMSEIVG